MTDRVPEFGGEAFSTQRAHARTRSRTEREARRQAAEAALALARQAFVDHAAEVYAHPAAAARDADRLEHIADRLVEIVEAFEPLFDRLEVARDLALYRGPVLGRLRGPWAPDRIIGLMAECVSEDLLSQPAAAVLAAAARARSL